MATLREERERADLTQTDLARQVGLNQRTISNYESGRRVPSVRRAREIETALGVAPGSIDWPRPDYDTA